MEITNIKFLKYNDDDEKILKDYLSQNTEATKTFRYFKKRDFNVINNHIYTALYFNNNDIIGYGHLDREDNTVWLGIMVSDKFRRLGIGNKIITNLIENYDGEINLSVDKKNISAINLYKSKNFIKLKDNNEIIIMKLKK